MKCTLSGKRGCNSTTGLVDSLRTCAFFASMVSTPSVSTFEMLPSTVDYYSVPLSGMLQGGGPAGGIAKAAKKAARKQAKVEAGQLGAAATKASLAAARASPDPLPPPPPELMVDGPRLWLTNCDGPGAQPARNAAHDEFDSLHLLWHNTGLGTQRALFELHHCDIPPEERADLIDRIRREVEAETAQKKAAQAGVAQRYREHNNDQQRLYVCACCDERNKEDTGKYTRVQLSALRFKWVSAAH